MTDRLTSPIKLALVKDEDRDFVLSLEASILKFIEGNDNTDNNPITDCNFSAVITNKDRKDKNNHVECLYLEPNLNSYYRLLSHQIAEYYGLQHFLIKRKNLIMLKKRKTENDSSQPLVLPDRLRDISVANLKRELISNGHYIVQNESNNTTAINGSKTDVQENEKNGLKTNSVEYRSDSPQPRDFETSSYKIELQERQQIYYTNNYINSNGSNCNKKGISYTSINRYPSKNDYENDTNKINNNNNNNGIVPSNKVYTRQKYYNGTITNKTKNYYNNNNLNYKNVSSNNTNKTSFLNNQNQLCVPMDYRHSIPVQSNNNANTVIPSTSYSPYFPVNGDRVMSHSYTPMQLFNVMPQGTDINIGTISKIDHLDENRFEVLEQGQERFVSNGESASIDDVNAGDKATTRNVGNKKPPIVVKGNNKKDSYKNYTTLSSNKTYDTSLDNDELHENVIVDGSDNSSSGASNNGDVSCGSSTNSSVSSTGSFKNPHCNYQEYTYYMRNYDTINNAGMYQYHYPYNKGKINCKQNCCSNYKNNYKNKNIKGTYYNNNNNAIYSCNTYLNNNNNNNNKNAQENCMYFTHPTFQQQQQPSNFFPVQMLSVTSLPSVSPLPFGMMVSSAFMPVGSNNMPNNIGYTNDDSDFTKTKIGYYGQFATNINGITSNPNAYYYKSHVNTCDNRFAMKYGNYYYYSNIGNNVGSNNIKSSSEQGYNRNTANIFLCQ